MGERRGTKALELWCRRMVEGYDVRVDNMTTSWRDGLAFCALVSKCSSLKQMPDLIHFDELKKENIYHNNELAFRLAEEYMNIPALLDPQDMVDYEVPDKLSILTYLSQFYQVFGAQENSLRLSKRSSTSEANKSSPSTPPAKMAHVVPKREPCVKCKNQVFLAERLQINQSLYHRTCFRCARCESVLTLGNFYETEKDHEYCCETCPDEEKTRGPKVEESNRLSIAQKIALFEKESSNVLKKSLSDEEKSKSLHRQPTANSEALNSFLTKQIKTQAISDDDDDKTSSDSDSDDEGSTAPPSIPSNHPTDNIPSISDEAPIISDHKIISKATPDDFVVTKELTHDQDTEAIAVAADTLSESLDVRSKIDSAHIVVNESDEKVPDDDIDTLFEQLAEDAISSPVKIVPIAILNSPVKPEPSIVKPPISAKPVELISSPVIVPASVTDDKKLDVDVEQKTTEMETKEKIPEVKAEEKIPEIENEVEENEVVGDAPMPEEAVQDAALESVVKVEPVPVITIEPSSPAPSSTTNLSLLEDSKSEIESNKPDDDAEYPDDLNPFGDDEGETKKLSHPEPPRRSSLNPFGSDDDDEESEYNKSTASSRYSGTLPKPPRPPPPKTATFKAASTNPFGSDDEDDEPSKPTAMRTPIPTPRKPLLHSTTPEPTPRSLSNHNSPGHSFKGSTSSLSSSTDGMSLRRRKKKAPAPPPPPGLASINNDETTKPVKPLSITPKKKRPAPTPPTSTPKPSSQDYAPSLYITASDFPSTDDLATSEPNDSLSSSIDNVSMASSQPPRRLIPLEECLVEEGSNVNHSEAEEVTYRRKIVPLSPQSTAEESFESHGRTKDDKEAQNRQRQSQVSLMNMRAGSESTDSLPYLNKSSHGKWKRRKGPAPALPGFAQPQRRIMQMLPLQEIRQELEVIEVQQQGLEKQGVMLEKMIRERCEGSGDNRTTEELLETLPTAKNPKEVEELILQLFELVNEKNELFRRQAELMYLKRAHRLEEEQADVEYEIRTLMAQPEQNKTDSDKTKEEALIARLVEIVQLRNEVVDGLDRDRLREAEEDLSIKQRMESHTAQLDQDYLQQTPTKLSKKEKKKLKEAKKLKSNKKLDADKDLDTSEIKSETSEKKKKKKKFLF